MSQIEVQIMQQSYTLSCPPELELQLREAVQRLDAAMIRIRDAGKVRGRDRIAVLAALNLAVELGRTSTSAEAVDHSTKSGSDSRIDPQSVERLQSLQTQMDRVLRNSSSHDPHERG